MHSTWICGSILLPNSRNAHSPQVHATNYKQQNNIWNIADKIIHKVLSSSSSPLAAAEAYTFHCRMQLAHTKKYTHSVAFIKLCVQKYTTSQGNIYLKWSNIAKTKKDIGKPLVTHISGHHRDKVPWTSDQHHIAYDHNFRLHNFHMGAILL